MSDVDKPTVIRAIQRLAEENGGVSVGRDRFVAETGLPEYLFQGRLWINWSEAVREAGYEPNPFGVARLDDDHLLWQLAELTRKLGKFPTKANIRMEGRTNSSFPSATTFGVRIGTKSQQITALRAFIERTPEFTDIAAMLPAIASEPILELAESNDEHATQPVPGHVYLVKSGKFHKIGRSNDHGRRTYEIGLQLPDKLEVVHTIETDDAVGIEHYWHERFRNRRRNGEWFQLTKADVAAFRRRRSFM
ncbi:GIY-YIG nuclease family protein [Mycobacterium intracellulare]|uniref:GIY-YIG nuclease family protein n=1 Tax=Mycobacterium intracellulare subsp. chimaera TaxID=222805 RepID=A0A7U5MMK2_MYCIT|nr:GIY-YIG nuclease family protein [Mycobacterium intracellulare]ASL16252.1 hypothetical protein MYCOZU2_03878 [Mycobacterium intracellulare subsp. chimaera]ASQ87339.1 hypothetical protein CE197_18435 [Mycobacterium intracellulare subsp. chimaera]MCF1814178.1 GIY-YIG nuclease family protein [Mycobacterium intracellulare subsp. intracellulare]MDM3928982.1 GIY-YIG nuclease family protein [Mycobacterium intracellulare subsp. chimaera]MDS0335982.1 GIY-YIG nuclease family protein [Mycobacterium int